MARSSVVDPLEKFRFQVTWSADGESESTALVRLGFHDIQMPKRATTVITYREGIDPDVPQKAPGLSSTEDIVMSRGVIITDANGEFYKWISAVHNPTAGHVGREAVKARNSNAASNRFRKDVTIQMLDREGNVARQWILHQAFPMNFVPGSDLGAQEDGEKSMEQLTLAYEDFQELDPASGLPKATSASLPS
jgi:phage tail-like protein